MPGVTEGILKTVAWFDVSDFPLTAEEIWRWWYGTGGAVTPEAIRGELDALVAHRRLDHTGGFFHLPGRAALVALRLSRQEGNKGKWQRAIRASRWLRFIPFVRLVAVCNTVAINNAKPESDVDLFIVAKRGRLWLVRLLVTAVVSMLGLRRHGRRIANRLCLSFFISDAALDFQPLLLPPEDPYFAFWTDQLVPLFDRGGVQAALRERNRWVKEWLPNAFTTRSVPTAAPVRLQGWKEKVLTGRFGDWCERFARSVQRGKMRVSPNAAASGAAVIGDDVLKFHEHDRRAEYRAAWQERFRQLRQ